MKKIATFLWAICTAFCLCLFAGCDLLSSSSSSTESSSSSERESSSDGGSEVLVCTIEFMVDGEVYATRTAQGQSITMPNNPTKADYVFDGWYWDEGNWNKKFTLNSIADQPLTQENRFQVYAKWKSTTKYTVAFAAGTGQGEMEDVTMTVGTETALPKNTFTPRNGYVFDGWNTEDDGTGVSYADQASVVDLCAAGETITLYAQWRRAVCNVTFDGNGGTGSMPSREVYTYTSVDVACEFTPPTGMEFNGWNSKADGTGTPYGWEKIYMNVEDGSDVLLYAQWREKAKEYYKISFVANGGSGSMPAKRVERDTEITLGQPTFTPPDEYTAFKEWNTKADGSGLSIGADEPVMNLTGANQEITLYAQWADNYYTLILTNGYSEDGHYEQWKCAAGEVFTLGSAEKFTAPEYCQFECWRVASEEPTYALKDLRGIGANEEISDLAEVGETLYLYADWKIASDKQLYSVSTFAQLKSALQNKVDKNTVIVLEKDIDCGQEYMPSCPEFAGTFIGNGHTIKNLIIGGDNSGGVQSGGLFGNITSTGRVVGLALENLISTGSYAVSFAYQNQGEIRSCYVLNGSMNYAGNASNTDVAACGLVYENAQSGSIIDCYFSGEVGGSLQSGNGNGYAAGICFRNQGVMEYVYFYGRIYGSWIWGANLFCFELQGSTAYLGYCQWGENQGVTFGQIIDCDYAEKFTAETLYENRYNMNCAGGAIMHEDMDLNKGSLGVLPISYNNWYHR